MTLFEKDFYCQIGLLSTGFAKLEHSIREIIHLLIDVNCEFVSKLLIQENSTSQNQQLLVKIARVRHNEEEQIVELNKMIDSLRINRNLFVHGDWRIHQEEGKGPIFVCSTTKVTFKKGTYGISTMRNTYDGFSLSDLELEVQRIQHCIDQAKEIIARLNK